VLAGTVPDGISSVRLGIVVNTEDLAPCCDHNFLTHRSVVAILHWSDSPPKRARQSTASVHAKPRPLSPVRNRLDSDPSPCSERIIPYRFCDAGPSIDRASQPARRYRQPKQSPWDLFNLVKTICHKFKKRSASGCTILLGIAPAFGKPTLTCAALPGGDPRLSRSNRTCQWHFLHRGSEPAL
jgi:hypothetical protein